MKIGKLTVRKSLKLYYKVIMNWFNSRRKITQWEGGIIKITKTEKLKTK